MYIEVRITSITMGTCFSIFSWCNKQVPVAMIDDGRQFRLTEIKVQDSSAVRSKLYGVVTGKVRMDVETWFDEVT
jgi:hypothetical protein